MSAFEVATPLTNQDFSVQGMAFLEQILLKGIFGVPHLAQAIQLRAHLQCFGNGLMKGYYLIYNFAAENTAKVREAICLLIFNVV